MSRTLTRRSLLRGLVAGSAVSVGVPFLDAFLDGKGRALAASGAPLPVRFGTWFWGLGLTPGRWMPAPSRAAATWADLAQPARPTASAIRRQRDLLSRNRPAATGRCSTRTAMTAIA